MKTELIGIRDIPCSPRRGWKDSNRRAEVRAGLFPFRLLSLLPRLARHHVRCRAAEAARRGSLCYDTGL